MQTSSDVLRRIAGTELDKLFPGVTEDNRETLVTSLVRQWLTSGGHASILTFHVIYWLQVEETSDQRLNVHAETMSANGLCTLLRRHQALEEDIPRILRDLTFRQVAVFDNEEMTTFQIRIYPDLRQFEIDPVDESLHENDSST